MKGMLAPEYKEVVTAHAEVREIFKVTGTGTVAGSMLSARRIVMIKYALFAMPSFTMAN